MKTEIEYKNMLKIKDIIKLFNRQLNDYIIWILCELDEIIYNSQYILFQHKNQLKYDYILAQQIEVLRHNLNSNATAQTIRDLDEINIVDINSWLEDIVFRVNFTDNKMDIMEWLTNCMDRYVLSYLNSKIRLRTQIQATEWSKWEPMVTHSMYIDDITLKV